MKVEEKLRELLKDADRAGKSGAAFGNHLRDEDFIRLIKNKSFSETNALPNVNGKSPVVPDALAPLRRHLADCDSCLNQFQDFYHFFAPAETGESVAGKSEIDVAWKAFAPRIVEKEIKPSLWARLFPIEKKSNYFAAFGWAFASLLLLFTGFAGFVAWQAKNENSQLAEQLERQKQSSEERLKTLEQSEQNQDLAEQEKNRLQAEKTELEKRLAALQIEIEQAKKERPAVQENALPQIASKNSPADKIDNSLVAVNTPIYDVFPGDAVVRGGNQSANKLAVPNQVKSVVLILNAAGRADFPVYQAALVSGAGKVVWRGGGLRKDSTGNFTLTISRAALKTGNYQLKLSSGGQTVAEYPIAIEIGK